MIIGLLAAVSLTFSGAPDFPLQAGGAGIYQVAPEIDLSIVELDRHFPASTRKIRNGKEIFDSSYLMDQVRVLDSTYAKRGIYLRIGVTATTPRDQSGLESGIKYLMLSQRPTAGWLPYPHLILTGARQSGPYSLVSNSYTEV